jgi:membrane-associated phospholipid phosphatase
MEWVVNIRSEFLTTLFKLFTALGNEPFILVFLPIIYWWSSEKEKMSRLGIVVLFTIVLNGLLKGIFQIPRPDVIPWLVHADGYGFPSGHAQTSAVLWGYLAVSLRKSWMWWISIILILGISTSRVYLGVHSPLDISAGMLIGLSTVILFEWLRRLPLEGWNALGSLRQTMVIAVAMMGVYMIAPEIDETMLKGGGTFLGYLLGLGFIREQFPQLMESRTAPVVQNIFAVIIGLVIVIILKVGIKVGFQSIG